MALGFSKKASKIIREKGIDFVMLDSISRSGFGDLNENRPVNAIIDCLNNLCPTWLALGHTPRASEEHVYGSIHFEAGADIVVQLMSEQKEIDLLGIAMQIVKANDIPKFPVETLAMEFDTLGLSNIRFAKKWEFPELASKRKTSLEEEILDYLSENSKASATQIANATGHSRSKISLLLNHNDKFVQLPKEGKEVLYGIRY